MNEPNRTQWQIRCAFNGFCKQALKREAMNAHRDTKRQQSREVTFSDLSPLEESQLVTYDKYFADDEAEQSFILEAMYRGTKRNIESEPESGNAAAG